MLQISSDNDWWKYSKNYGGGCNYDFSKSDKEKLFSATLQIAFSQIFLLCEKCPGGKL